MKAPSICISRADKLDLAKENVAKATAKRTAKPKRRPATAYRKLGQLRAAFLHQLRNESAAAFERQIEISVDNTPLLAGLVVAAAAQPGANSIWYRGIVFPVRVGCVRSIRCPETGQALVGIDGGWLV